MNKVGIVILSRFNSSRLPGKALIKIEGKPVLKHIYDSISTVVPTSQITIATSEESSDNQIAEFCAEYDINCYRGSLTNVAQRFFNAGKSLACDYVTRINGDNIFVDISLLRSMMEVAQNTSYPFISNVKDRTYPKGMSIEIVSLEHYRKVLPEITRSEYHKEHVTSYLYEYPLKEYKFIYNTEYPEVAGIQLALDDVDDLKRTKEIFRKLKNPLPEYGVKDIYNIIKSINND